MHFIEYVKNEAFTYSYAITRSGYIIKICSSDNMRCCTTAGVSVPREYIEELMEHLVSKGAAPETMHSIIADALADYYEKHPIKSKSFSGKYLYL